MFPACHRLQTRDHLAAVLIGAAAALVPLAAVGAYSDISPASNQFMWGLAANLGSLFYFASPLRWGGWGGWGECAACARENACAQGGNLVQKFIYMGVKKFIYMRVTMGMHVYIKRPSMGGPCFLTGTASLCCDSYALVR